MNRFVRWSMNAYRGLLLFYSDDLRRDFGPEMLEAFSRDLAAECTARSVRGAIRVWRITLCEVVRVGLPGQLPNPSVAVPAISAAGTAFYLSSILLATFLRNRGNVSRRGGSAPAEIALSIFIPAAVSALVSFAAVRKRKSEAILSLGLG